MFNRLEGVEKRFSEVETLLSDPEIIRNQDTYRKYAREHADIGKIVTVFREYKKILGDIDDSMELMRDEDPEMKELARIETETLTLRKNTLGEKLRKLLMPE